ncbi:MAG: hypothetical protein GOU99_01040 [Candidatus Altiarchaeota archaeon]|nr:hypothetical protein [Candidatus Altiarchaeota archaeon]
MELALSIDEIKKIEKEKGIKLKRIRKEDVKFLEKPSWAEKKQDGLAIEVPAELGYELFKTYKVKIIRK